MIDRWVTRIATAIVIVVALAVAGELTSSDTVSRSGGAPAGVHAFVPSDVPGMTLSEASTLYVPAVGCAARLPAASTARRAGAARLAALMCNGARVRPLLRPGAEHERALARLERLARDEAFAGVALDLRQVPPDLRQDLTRTVEDVAAIVRRHDGWLAVFVPPVEREPSAGTSAFDYPAIARRADWLVVRATRPDALRQNGPPDPTGWTQQVLDHLRGVAGPHHVVVLTTPTAVTRCGVTAQLMPTRRAAADAASHDATVTTEDGVAHARFTAAGRSCDAWFHTASTLAQRRLVVERTGARFGIADPAVRPTN